MTIENVPRSYHQYLNLENEITNQVIARRVCVDINLYGGEEAYIPCSQLEAEYVDRWNTIYKVPKRLTNGRDITRVVALAYGQGSAYAGYNNTSNAGSAIVGAANGIMAAAGPMPIVQTAFCHIINPNVILVTDGSGVLVSNGYLRVWLGHDKTLSHLQTTTFLKFYELCLLAVKAEIYSKNIITIDREVVEGGFDIGVYKTLVEGYADAAELYQEYLSTKWSVVTILNDPRAAENHTRMIMGGRF